MDPGDSEMFAGALRRMMVDALCACLKLSAPQPILPTVSECADKLSKLLSSLGYRGACIACDRLTDNEWRGAPYCELCLNANPAARPLMEPHHPGSDGWPPPDHMRLGGSDRCQHGGLRRKCQICDDAAELARLRARVEELERERDDLRARLVCVHDAVKQDKSLDLIRVEVGYWLTCDDEIIQQCARELDAAREGGVGGRRLASEHPAADDEPAEE